MKNINKLILIPLISPLLLILISSPFNLNKTDKIKIFIWQTPSLPIGVLLALGSTSGALIGASLQLLINNNVDERLRRKVRINQHEEKFKSFNENPDDKISNDQDDKNTSPQVNTQRDIRDPAPTISVPFRILNNDEMARLDIDDTEEFDNNQDSYYEEAYEYQNENEPNSYVDSSDDLRTSTAGDWSMPIEDDW